MKGQATEFKEELLHCSDVAKRYGVHPITLKRWSRDATLGFPQAVLIRKRRYWYRQELEAFERSRVGRAR